MSPDNPFLRALLAQPDDDTLRLAMADWLDENDQPLRAELIRVQIELARGVEERDRRVALELRQRDLLIAHDKEWTKPIADVLGCEPGEWGAWVFHGDLLDSKPGERGALVFHRGFVEYFHLPVTVINRRGEQLARLTPVRELFLSPCNSANVVTLCKRPWLRSVTALYLRRARLYSNAVHALINCPYLENLRVLEAVAGNVSEETVKKFHRRFGQHLVRSPHA
jgi:uncharacterized protein (TIGR02996 family)